MTVFVAGIHGVGKSYLCESFSARTGIPHHSASALIKAERAGASWGTDKVVTGADENQLALAAAVKRVLSENPDLILDGHFVLKDKFGGFLRLAESVFSQLNLSAVILLENDSDLIFSRLHERDGNKNPGDIVSFLEIERAQARQVCQELNLPLKVLFAPTPDFFHDSIISYF